MQNAALQCSGRVVGFDFSSLPAIRVFVVDEQSACLDAKSCDRLSNFHIPMPSCGTA